jgi:hypothetical protein
MNKEEKMNHVRAVIQLLGLQSCENSLVGGVSIHRGEEIGQQIICFCSLYSDFVSFLLDLV